MLSLETIRRYARNEGYTEVQFNDTSVVIGFTRGDQRVNVYWTTGTVGTCVNHPTQGKTQLFRRNQTLQNVHRTLQNPRVHTGAGYYRRVGSGRPEPSTSSSRSGLWCCLATDALTDNLVKYCNDDTEVLALGYGYFCVQRDGSTWWQGITRSLQDKMRGIESQPERSAVDYAALGPDEYYFLQLRDGRKFWLGPDSLGEALHEAAQDVALLAFAPDDGWFVLWEDGSSDWEGLPLGLHNQINGRMNSMPEGALGATVEELAIGPNGEWFVRYADGGWRAQGLCTGLSATLKKLQSQGHDIASIVFGEDYTWAIRY